MMSQHFLQHQHLCESRMQFTTLKKDKSENRATLTVRLILYGIYSYTYSNSSYYFDLGHCSVAKGNKY